MVLVGMGVAIIPILTITMFNDDNSLAADHGSAAEPLLRPRKDAGRPHCILKELQKVHMLCLGLLAPVAWHGAQSGLVGSAICNVMHGCSRIVPGAWTLTKGCMGAEEGRGQEAGPKPGKWLCLTPAAVPYLLAASDAIYGLASGMTIKFFPVFWIQEVALSPVMVQFMSALVPLLLALSSYAMHPLALVIGASPVALAHICLLPCMRPIGRLNT